MKQKKSIPLKWYDIFHDFIIKKGFSDAYNNPLVPWFYAQSFKFSKIVKLFKYWECQEIIPNVDIQKRPRCYYYRNKSGERVDLVVDYDNGFYYIKWHDITNTIDTFKCIIPKTLNEFINDCQRHKIKLKFKISYC